MSPRRRRAAVSAVAALVAGLLCVLIGSATDGGRRLLLLALAVVWVALAGSSLRGAVAQDPAPEPDPVPPSSEEPSAPPAEGVDGGP